MRRTRIECFVLVGVCLYNRNNRYDDITIKMLNAKTSTKLIYRSLEEK